jgi:carboxymethylenebutenolidase
MLSSQAFEAIGAVFARRGWVFFAPYRRGQGLSASAGPFIGDEIAEARKHAFGWYSAALAALLLLLLILTRRQRRWIRGIGVVVVAVFAAYVVPLSVTRAGTATMVRLLETDHLDDQLAGLAWLQRRDYVRRDRIAVAGNSFGGIEAVLGAERVKYCAAIDASGGAESWAHAPQLQARMTAAVRNSQVPILFFQAENDYNLTSKLTCRVDFNA